MTNSGDVPPYADSEIIMKPIDADDEIELLRQKLEFAEFEWNRAIEAMQERDDRIEALEAALERIVQWSEAYPLDIFPEPNWNRVRTLLTEDGLSLDAISASNMRHVVEGVGKIARAALAPELDK